MNNFIAELANELRLTYAGNWMPGTAVVPDVVEAWGKLNGCSPVAATRLWDELRQMTGPQRNQNFYAALMYNNTARENGEHVPLASACLIDLVCDYNNVWKLATITPTLSVVYCNGLLVGFIGTAVPGQDIMALRMQMMSQLSPEYYSFLSFVLLLAPGEEGTTDATIGMVAPCGTDIEWFTFDTPQTEYLAAKTWLTNGGAQRSLILRAALKAGREIYGQFHTGNDTVGEQLLRLLDVEAKGIVDETPTAADAVEDYLASGRTSVDGLNNTTVVGDDAAADVTLAGVTPAAVESPLGVDLNGFSAEDTGFSDVKGEFGDDIPEDEGFGADTDAAGLGDAVDAADGFGEDATGFGTDEADGFGTDEAGGFGEDEEFPFKGDEEADGTAEEAATEDGQEEEGVAEEAEDEDVELDVSVVIEGNAVVGEILKCAVTNLDGTPFEVTSDMEYVWSSVRDGVETAIGDSEVLTVELEHVGGTIIVALDHGGYLYESEPTALIIAPAVPEEVEEFAPPAEVAAIEAVLAEDEEVVTEICACMQTDVVYRRVDVARVLRNVIGDFSGIIDTILGSTCSEKLNKNTPLEVQAVLDMLAAEFYPPDVINTFGLAAQAAVTNGQITCYDAVKLLARVVWGVGVDENDRDLMGIKFAGAVFTRNGERLLGQGVTEAELLERMADAGYSEGAGAAVAAQLKTDNVSYICDVCN
jgi:hypothetical protein